VAEGELWFETGAEGIETVLARETPQECLVSQGTTSNVLYMLLDGSVSTHVLENWRVDRQDSESDSSEYSSEYSTDEDDRDDDSRPSSRNNNTRRSVSPSARAGGSMSDIKRMMSRAGSMKAPEDEGAASSGIDLIDRYGECVTVLFANDVLGEMALGEEEKHTMSAVTREPTEALLLPVSTLRAAVEERPFPLELERVKRLLARRPADRREDELRELLPLLEYCPYLRTLAPHVRMAVCR
jgi:CRP-like cAMP-binding protein